MFINVQKYLCCEEIHSIQCRKDFFISKYHKKYTLCKEFETDIKQFSIDIKFSTLIEGIPDYFTLYHRNILGKNNSSIREEWELMGDLYKNGCKEYILNHHRQLRMKHYKLNEEDVRVCAILNLNSDTYKIYPYEDGVKIYNEIIEALSNDEVIYTIDTNNIEKEN